MDESDNWRQQFIKADNQFNWIAEKYHDANSWLERITKPLQGFTIRDGEFVLQMGTEEQIFQYRLGLVGKEIAAYLREQGRILEDGDIVSAPINGTVQAEQPEPAEELFRCPKCNQWTEHKDHSIHSGYVDMEDKSQEGQVVVDYYWCEQCRIGWARKQFPPKPKSHKERLREILDRSTVHMSSPGLDGIPTASYDELVADILAEFEEMP